MDPKYGGGIDFDNVLGKLKGHRSQVKVAGLKNVIFGFSDRLTCAGVLYWIQLKFISDSNASS